MRNWERRIGELQREQQCDPALRADEVSEIAGHLEEIYLNQLRQGASSEEAEKRAWSEIQDWRRLCRGIFEAQREETMSETMRKIWLPSVALLLLSIAAISGSLLNGAFPHGFNLDSQVALFLYAPWILGSFALGFLGAFWARRIGLGKGATPLLFLLPAGALILLFIAKPPVTWSLVPQHPGRLVAYLAECLTMWGVVPGVAALAGVMTAGLMQRKNSSAS